MAARGSKNIDSGLNPALPHKKKKRPRPKVLEGSKWTYFGHFSGWCHFHIVTNQKRDGALWVELMASCDRETRFWIPWEDLDDPIKGWHTGWVKDET